MEALHVRPCPGCGTLGGREKFKEPPFIVIKCPSCSLVYLGNPPKEDRLYDEYYSSVAPNSTEYRSGSNDPRLRELYVINQQRVVRLQLLKTNCRLLDVGCGRGHFLTMAREHGYQAYGIDVSEGAVAYARNEFGLDADVCSLKEIVASGKQFDVITLWHVLEHFADPYEALRLISVLLKSGGMCVIEVPNLRSMKFMLSRTKWQGGNRPLYHRTFFSAGTLRDALLRNGFSTVQRLDLSYRVPGRSRFYEAVKKSLNVLAMDAFLDFVAWK